MAEESTKQEQSISSNTEAKPENKFLTAAKDVAQKAFGKLQESVRRIKPETKGYVAGAVATGALAAGHWFLAGYGVNLLAQMDGGNIVQGMSDFIRIGNEVTGVNSGLAPEQRMQLINATVTTPVFAAAWTGISAFLGKSAYNAQRG